MLDMTDIFRYFLRKDVKMEYASMKSLRYFVIFSAVIALTITHAYAANDTPTDSGLIPSLGVDEPSVSDNAGLPGVALHAEDLDEEAGNPLIVVIIVRGGVKVIQTTCSKSPSTCRSIAANIAKKAGGAIAATATGRAAVNSFCDSRWAKYGGRICK